MIPGLSFVHAPPTGFVEKPPPLIPDPITDISADTTRVRWTYEEPEGFTGYIVKTTLVAGTSWSASTLLKTTSSLFVLNSELPPLTKQVLVKPTRFGFEALREARVVPNLGGVVVPVGDWPEPLKLSEVDSGKKTNVSNSSGLSLTGSEGECFVVNGNITGKTITLSGTGTKLQPVMLRGDSDSANPNDWPIIDGGTINVRGTCCWLYKLRFKGPRINWAGVNYRMMRCQYSDRQGAYPNAIMSWQSGNRDGMIDCNDFGDYLGQISAPCGFGNHGNGTQWTRNVFENIRRDAFNTSIHGWWFIGSSANTTSDNYRMEIFRNLFINNAGTDIFENKSSFTKTYENTFRDNNKGGVAMGLRYRHGKGNECIDNLFVGANGKTTFRGGPYKILNNQGALMSLFAGNEHWLTWPTDPYNAGQRWPACGGSQVGGNTSVEVGEPSSGFSQYPAQDNNVAPTTAGRTDRNGSVVYKVHAGTTTNTVPGAQFGKQLVEYKRELMGTRHPDLGRDDETEGPGTTDGDITIGSNYALNWGVQLGSVATPTEITVSWNTSVVGHYYNGADNWMGTAAPAPYNWLATWGDGPAGARVSLGLANLTGSAPNAITISPLIGGSSPSVRATFASVSGYPIDPDHSGTLHGKCHGIMIRENRWLGMVVSPGSGTTAWEKYRLFQYDLTSLASAPTVASWGMGRTESPWNRHLNPVFLQGNTFDNYDYWLCIEDNEATGLPDRSPPHNPGRHFVLRCARSANWLTQSNWTWLTALGSESFGSYAGRVPSNSVSSNTLWRQSWHYDPVLDLIMILVPYGIASDSQFRVYTAPRPWMPWTLRTSSTVPGFDKLYMASILGPITGTAASRTCMMAAAGSDVSDRLEVFRMTVTPG